MITTVKPQLDKFYSQGMRSRWYPVSTKQVRLPKSRIAGFAQSFFGSGSAGLG
jgi:hypothetical protein